MRAIPLAFLLVAASASAGCSSSNASSTSPASVAGTYTVNVTDGQNGCNIPNFTSGAMTSDISVVVSACGSQVCANVQGVSGFFLSVGVGTSTLTGSIQGNTATLTASASHANATCMYTTTATATLTFDGNTMQGTMTYTDSGNGSPDCGVAQQCTSEQTFAGSRPPPSG